MCWICLKGIQISPNRGNGKRHPIATVRCSLHTHLTAVYLAPTPNQRSYIGPHVQDYLVGLDAEYEERLTRWILGVQRALEAGDGLRPFSTAVADTPERTDRTLESDHLHTGPIEQRGAGRSVAERHLIVGNRGASPCTYCGRALEEPTWDLAVDTLWALIPYPRGE